MWSQHIFFSHSISFVCELLSVVSDVSFDVCGDLVVDVFLRGWCGQAKHLPPFLGGT